MPEFPLKPGWTPVKFGDGVRLNTGRIADPETKGIERYVGIEHIEPEDLRIRSWGLVEDGTTFTNYFKPGQVLFVKRRAYQRKVAVAEFDGVCSGDIYVLEPKDERLLPDLLPFICQTESFFAHAVNTSAGSLSPRTNWRQLAEYEFALPPLAEQRRMVGVLSAARQVKEATSQLVEASESLQWSHAKQRLNRHRKKYPMRAVPKLTTRLTVGIVVKPADWYVPGNEGIPALRSLNVLPGRFDFSNLVCISEEGHRVHSKSELNPGDVVVVRSGRPGDAAVIPDDVGPLNCIDLVIASLQEEMLPNYFVTYLNSPLGRQAFASGTAGTAQKHFNVSAFKKLKVPCPPLTVQRALVDELNELQSAAARSEERSRSSSQLYNSLLNKLIGV